MINADNRRHIIIPVVWAGLRDRVSRAARFAFGATLNPLKLLDSVTLPLFRLWLDGVRCVPKARNLGWRFGVVAIVAALSVLIVGLWIGSIYLVAGLVFWAGPVGSPNYSMYKQALRLISLGAMTYGIKRLMPLFDFFGDVAAFIGQSDRRARIEKTMVAILNEAATRSPNAKILAVGHSLGSVLFASSLLRIKPEDAAATRVSLLTLGSPLRLLSYVFPDDIPTADQLLSAYDSKSTVTFWGNLWRDRDIIGRQIQPTVQSKFAEKSLGDGVHWGMWRDWLVWLAAHELANLNAAGLQELKRSWADDELNDEEKDEGLRYLSVLKVTREILVPIFIVWPVYVLWSGPYGRWFSHFPVSFSAPLVFLNAFMIAILISILVRTLTSIRPKDRSRREFLGVLRRGRGFCTNGFILASLAAVSCFVLLLFCPKP